MNTQTEPDRSAGESLSKVVLRGWWLVALCLVVGAAAAGLISSRETKEYQATSKLLFRNDVSADQSVESALGLSSSAPLPDPTQQAATNVALVSLGTVSSLTAQALGQQTTADQIKSEVAVSGVGQSSVVSVTATDSNPQRAAVIANTFARQFVLFRQNADRSVIETGVLALQNQLNSLSPRQRASVTGRSVTNRLGALSALAQTQIGDAELVQGAVAPSSPSSPRTKLNVGAGALVGLVLGIVLAVFRYRFGQRTKDPEELAEVYDRPLLGVVPRTPELLKLGPSAVRLTLGRGRVGSATGVLPAPTADALRAVRARVRHLNSDQRLRSVLVTSAVEGEGKSMISWQLARLVAMRGGRVLLIEADLRRPSLADAHGLDDDPGLVDALSRQTEVDEVVQHVPIDGLGASSRARNGHPPPTNGGRGQEERADPDPVQPGHGPGPAMDVIVAGWTPLNPSELLDSEAMSELLGTVADRYDLVILDAPPGSIVADTLPLLSLVDGVIVVRSMRHAAEDAAEDLRIQLDAAGTTMLGVVVNNAKRTRRDVHSSYRRRDAPLTSRGERNGHGTGPNGAGGTSADAPEAAVAPDATQTLAADAPESAVAPDATRTLAADAPQESAAAEDPGRHDEKRPQPADGDADAVRPPAPLGDASHGSDLPHPGLARTDAAATSSPAPPGDAGSQPPPGPRRRWRRNPTRG